MSPTQAKNKDLDVIWFTEADSLTPDWRLAAGGWRLAAGGWRLAAGGWRLAAGGWRLAAGE